jgi:hypothetical protein
VLTRWRHPRHDWKEGNMSPEAASGPGWPYPPGALDIATALDAAGLDPAGDGLSPFGPGGTASPADDPPGADASPLSALQSPPEAGALIIARYFWTCPMPYVASVCAVLILDPHCGMKAYIGALDPIGELSDAAAVQAAGARLDPAHGRAIFAAFRARWWDGDIR